MIRLPLAFGSPAGQGGRLSILIFHRVLPRHDPLGLGDPAADEFEARMRWVKDWFNVLPLREGVRRLYDGTIPSRALAITFDDGYADNEQIAAPILHRLGLSATFFVTTGYLGDGVMWNDRVIEAVRACAAPRLDLGALGLGEHPLGSHAERQRAVGAILTGIKHRGQAEREAAARAVAQAAGTGEPPRLMMQPDQVRALRAMGMDIGGHTVTHPILTRLSADAAFEEMRAGKTELERLLVESIELFAYPNGVPDQDYSAEHARMVRDCGFTAAVSTAWGAASARSDRFQLPRFTPWDRTRLRFGARLLLNLRNVEKRAA